MKNKIIFTFTLLLSFILPVYADTSYDVNIMNGVCTGFEGSSCSKSSIATVYNSYSSNIVDMFSTVYDLYQSDYSSDYPYYYVSVSLTDFSDSITPVVTFYLSSTLPTLSYSATTSLPYDATIIILDGSPDFTSYNSTQSLQFYYSGMGYNHNINGMYHYFFSNFDLIFSDVDLNTGDYFSYDYYNGSSQNGNSVIFQSLSYSNIFPTFYDTLELNFLSDFDTNQFTTVDLNDYEYIILSFIDYDNLISPIQFDYIGQPCLTQVNNFGQEDRTSTDRCFTSSTDWVRSRIFPSTSTLDSKGVYYIVPYDTNIENKVRINTRVFNINYVTSANSDNPTVEVNGRSYPAIPYSDLINTTTDNEDNGYIPGQSTPVWDITNDENFFSNLLENPLQTLGNIWSAIVSMFALIGTFISLLPITLQTFLITGFTVAIVLGIIKIIL